MAQDAQPPYKVYPNIRSLPIYNYMHFAAYSTVASACSPIFAGGISETISAIYHQVASIKENPDKEAGVQNALDFIENLDYSIFNTTQGVNFFYYAFASIVRQYKDTQGNWNAFDPDLTDYESMAGLFTESFANTENPLSFFLIIEEVRLWIDYYQSQIKQYFYGHDLSLASQEYLEFNKMDSILKQIDPENQTGEEISNKIMAFNYWLISNKKVIAANPDKIDSYLSESLKQFTRIYQILGYTEKSLQETSTFDFFAKKQDKEDQVKKEELKRIQETG